jgi:hypothetical protein
LKCQYEGKLNSNSEATEGTQTTIGKITKAKKNVFLVEWK